MIEKCPVCGGRGTTTGPFYDTPFPSGETVPCHPCRGKGVIPNPGPPESFTYSFSGETPWTVMPKLNGPCQHEIAWNCITHGGTTHPIGEQVCLKCKKPLSELLQKPDLTELKEVWDSYKYFLGMGVAEYLKSGEKGTRELLIKLLSAIGRVLEEK